MPQSVEMKLTGVADLVRTLNSLKRGVRNKISRGPLAKAGRAVAKEAKSRAPVDTGALRRSLTSVVRTGRSGVYVMVGPETGTKKNKRTGITSKTAFGKWLDNQGIKNRPANYAHLVEFGHAGPHPAPPRPFFRRAIEASKSKVIAILREGIKENLAKYYAKGRR